MKALEKQVSSHVKSLEDARARAAAADEDLERFRQQQRRTPEGGLRQEVFRLGAAKAEAEAQVCCCCCCCCSCCCCRCSCRFVDEAHVRSPSCVHHRFFLSDGISAYRVVWRHP